MNTRRIIWSLATLSLLLFAWFKWKTPAATVATTPENPRLRIGTLFRALDYAPYYVARDRGWLDDAVSGVAELEYVPTFQTPPSANEAMASDRLDILLTADVPAIVARSAGIKLRLVMLSCTLNSQVVVRANSNDRSLADLRGKRISVAFGTGPHYGLVEHLRRASLLPPAVELLDMVPPDAKAAFAADAVDAWAIFPPYVEQEVLGGHGRVLQDVVSPVQVVVAVREGALRQHAAAVESVLAAMVRAKQWLMEHPEEAQAMLSEELELPVPVVELGWQSLDWQASIGDDDVQLDLQSKADFLVNQGFVKRQVVIGELMSPQDS